MAKFFSHNFAASITLFLNALFLAALLFFVLWNSRSFPFFLSQAPALAYWAGGFAQSIANGSLLYPYATNFGLPVPQPVPFSLPVIWLAACFIRLNLHAFNALAFSYCIFLLIAFAGAFLFAKKTGAKFHLAALFAFLWLTLPMIPSHINNFGPLGAAFALLPAYMLCAWEFFSAPEGAFWKYGALYLLAAIFSLFMDGYSFVMFALASTVWIMFLAFFHIKNKNPGRFVLKVLWHFFCFAAAYCSYKLYSCGLPMPAYHVSSYYSFGMDLAFFVPARGDLLIFDLLDLSARRNPPTYIGDISVWFNQYAALACAGLAVFFRIRKNRMAVVFFIAALISFWLSLGPYIKFDVVGHHVVRPPDSAIPTGNLWLYQHLPGLTTMRATYRWGILTAFSLWVLVLLWAVQSRKKVVPFILVSCLIACDIPSDYARKIPAGHYKEALEYENFIIPIFKENVGPNEKAAFFPPDNDFFLNYVSAATPFKTFNAGGDKNILLAKPKWPKQMAANFRKYDLSAEKLAALLQDENVDVIVVPFIGWGHRPTGDPAQGLNENWRAIVSSLAEQDKADITFTPYFAFIRPLKNQTASP